MPTPIDVVSRADRGGRGERLRRRPAGRDPAARGAGVRGGGWIETATGEATVLEPPTRGQGARRVWSDSTGRIWVSEWNAGQLAVFDPGSREWHEWRLPGPSPQAYAVFVDEHDQVWVSDFGANALVRFDPTTETFTAYQLPGPASNVRQILGRPGEVWGAASALDQLVVVRTS